MSPKYSVQERLRLIKRVIFDKEPVAKVCRETGISRVLFYRWLKKYKEAPNQPEALTPGRKKLQISPRKVAPEQEELILKIVKKNPRWSTKKISAALPKDSLGKPIVGNHGVQNVLQRLNLSIAKARIAHVKKISRPKEEVITGVKLSPEQKLEMLEKVVVEKKPVSKICQEYGISRTLFYRLKRRYEEAALEEKLKAVSPQVRHITRYWRQTPQRYEQAVLNLVAKHPEYSVRGLVANLPQVAGVPIISHHGVQNILRRYNLSLYEQRLAFSRAQVTPVTRLIGAWEQVFARFFVFPAETRATIVRFTGVTALTTFITVVVLGSLGYFATVLGGAAPVYRPGLFFATIALSVGSLFFLYSMKYYFTLAVVLSFSRQPASPDGSQGGPGESAVLGLNGPTSPGASRGERNGNGGWLARIFGSAMQNGNGNGKERRVVGLEPNLESVELEKHPFISIHLPFYNEKKVADRILSACTSFDYENYEVVVVDDSTDETIEILEKWKSHPKVKIIHRETREGFKGGALREALRVCDPRTEFVVVFDADFIPYPDTLELFLKYFKTYNNDSEDFSKSNIAAVQGYQWHVLNKSENWITRGIRSEYAGSYVIERSGTEVLGALKQIAGSVYMIRTDILKKFGWGTSITEDFELTLRLYEQGYKVVYTPYVQGPAECVATIKRLIRQRMRWGEGHSHNIRKMFLRILRSPKMTLTEKLEFLYLSPYYLQAFFFLIGTFSWLMAETVFRARLPFWTSLWGWSLVLTNFFALPLMNAVGLFLEEAEEKDYLGIFSFVALSYLLVPFQAYASVKGFLEKEEGPWFRTPKTGLITDIFTRGKFYRWISGIIPGRQPAVAEAMAGKPALILNPYLALATANNRFNSFNIIPKRNRYLGNLVIFAAVALSSTLFWFGGKISTGSLTDLPIQTRVERVGDEHTPLSYFKGIFVPQEALASEHNFKEVVLYGIQQRFSLETLAAVGLLVFLVSLGIFIYLLRRKRAFLKKSLKTVFVFLLVFSWLLSGWPQIWPLGELGVNKIRIPPEIREAGAATIKLVQSGTTSISGPTNTVTVTITSVDTSKAFLIFESRHDGNRPVNSTVRGRIATATTLEFIKVSNEAAGAGVINIQWYVVEYSSGVQVQRGEIEQAATTNNATITAVASLSQAFVTFSRTSDSIAGGWDTNDPMLCELTTTTNLQCRVNGTNVGAFFWWQVIEFTNAADINVQKGTVTTMTGTTLSVTATLGTAVDVAKTFLLVSFRNAGSGADIGARMLRAQLTNSTTITFDRNISGTPDDMTEIGWQVVELKDGTTVQRGSENFASTTSQKTVTITSVDTSQSIAFGSVQLGGGQNMGKSPYAADDIIGVCSVTMALSATSVTMDRNNTADTCDVGWFVVQFAKPAYEQAAYRFFENANSTDVGSPLAAQDTPFSQAVAQGTPFRLRLLLHISNAQLATSGQEFKLQIAQRGTDNLCDTSFSGETYADLSPTTGDIRYYDNTTPADGATLTPNVNDPTHGTDDIVNQTYEEANNFTNSQAAIPVGDDGKWDFAMVDYSATQDTTYCLRVVKSDATTLDIYTVIPEFTTVPENPLLLFGLYPILMGFLKRFKKKK